MRNELWKDGSNCLHHLNSRHSNDIKHMFQYDLYVFLLHHFPYLYVTSRFMEEKKLSPNPSDGFYFLPFIFSDWNMRQCEDMSDRFKIWWFQNTIIEYLFIFFSLVHKNAVPQNVSKRPLKKSIAIKWKLINKEDS